MKIYLDNCCFNRPFDDQSQLRIRLEAEAKLKIQADIRDGKFEFIWSYILEAENMVNPFEERKSSIVEWKSYSSMFIKENKTIPEKAMKLNQLGLRSKDALHIACAISARCNYFITTDDKIINKQNFLSEIFLTDPIGFIKEVYDDY
jgi:hypothetical protein